jgi:mannosyltransferase
MSLRPTEFKTRAPDQNTLIVLALLMAGVIIFSLIVLSNQSLRLDEAQSLWQTSHSPMVILQLVAGDVHVPLHHLLLHFWEKILGNSVALARDLSLIFFVATIPAVYLLGNLSFSRSTALFAAIMVAISPFLNWYGSEIRMYSLLTFITVLNQYFFILLYKKRPIIAGTWWGYGLTAFLGIFTHYFFGLVLLSEIVFYFFNRKLFTKNSFQRLIIIGFLLMMVLGPWLYYVYSLKQLGNSQPQLAKPTTVNLFNTFSQFLFGFQDDHVNSIIISLWPLSVLLAFLALRKKILILPDAYFFLLSALLPILVAFIISLSIRPLFLTRYLILTVPSLYIFLGWVISTYPKQLQKTIKAILIIGMLIMSFQQIVSAYTPVKENYREATIYLNYNVDPQDVIVVSAPFTIYPVEYYYRGSASITTLPIWDRFTSGGIPAFDPGALAQQVDIIKGTHARLWLLLSYDQGYENQIYQYFETHFQRISQHQFSPGLSLYEYKLRYDVLK